MNAAYRNLLIAGAIGMAIGSVLEMYYSQQHCRCYACRAYRETEKQIQGMRQHVGTTPFVVGNHRVSPEPAYPFVGNQSGVQNGHAQSVEHNPFVVQHPVPGSEPSAAPSGE